MTASLPALAGQVVQRMALADADDWAAFALLPAVQRFTSSNAASRAELLPMIERTLSQAPDAPLLFTVRERGTHELVASFGFHTISALNRTAELTYMVAPRHSGRGLATAIATAALAWAFDERRWLRVQATVLEANVASVRVLQKCGFAFEGRLRNFRLVRGVPCDFLLYARIPPAGAGIDPAPPGGG